MKLKRLGLVVMILGLTITTTACSRQKTTNASNGAVNPPAVTSTQPSKENNQATPSPTDKPSSNSQPGSISTVAPSTSSQPSSSSGEESKFYYGTWIIKKYMPTTNVSSLSEKDINGYIGQKIIIDGKQIVTNQGTIIDPIFKENILTSNDMLDGWRVQFSSLGIIGNTVTQVDVTNYKNETGNGLGAEIFFTNNNKVYTDIGGCFFELEK